MIQRQDNPSSKAAFDAAAALLGGGLALGITMMAMRASAAQRDGIVVRLRHELDPKIRARVSEQVKQIAQQGLITKSFGKPT